MRGSAFFVAFFSFFDIMETINKKRGSDDLNYIVQRIKAIPRYGWILGLVYFGLQYGMYRLANWIANLTGTVSWAFVPKIPMIDDHIPVVSIFVVIYLFSYVFWIFGPIFASLTRKENFINYIIGLSAAYIIGFLIFVFAPTYMDRGAEGLLNIASQQGFFNHLLGIVYSSDGSDLAFNLFPSYHCLISIYCYLGIRKQQEVSKGLRVYSLVMAILICLSTVFTKQHYFIDIIGGLSISFICYAVVQKINPAQRMISRRNKTAA